MITVESKKETLSTGRAMRPVKRVRPPAKRPQIVRIKRILRKHLPDLQERYGVASLGVFGSYVRGEAEQKSDLDILVEFRGRGITLFKFVEMENHLTRLLGIKVDLVMKSALKPAIGRQILSEVVML